MRRRKLETLNVGNLMVWLGLLWLGFGFWLPYATAERVFRLEDRAQRLTAAMRDAAVALPDLDWSRPADGERLLAQLPEDAGDLLSQVADPPRGEGFWFASKHYYFLVTRTPESLLGQGETVYGPRGEKKETAQPVAPAGRPIEVYAWPKKSELAGQAVFFTASDARPSFNRNLGDRHIGLAHSPQAGDGRVDIALPDNDYQGRDGERWLYMTPAGPHEEPGR